MSPAGSRHLDDPALTTPLARSWARKVPGASGAVYGSGLVIIQTGSRLVALDPRYGRRAWSTPSPVMEPSALAFADGVVVTVERTQLIGRDARTGAVRWRTPGDYSQLTLPVATGSRVFVNEIERLSAHDIGTGARRWSIEERSVGTGPPVADSAAVYSGTACGTLMAMDAATGVRRWRQPTDCSGAGGGAPILHRGRLYGDENRVSDAATGALVGTHLGGGRRVLGGDIGVFGVGGGLTARRLSTNRTLWAKRLELASEAPPMGIGSTLYAPSRRGLEALSMETGKREQLLRGPQNATDAKMVTSAPGRVLMASGGWVVAFESVYKPAANGIAAGTVTADLEFGGRTIAEGILGSALRASRPKATVLADSAPFRRYRRVLTVPSDAGGYVSVSSRLQRNTRLRFQVGAVRSNVVRLYVYPRFRSKLRRARNNPNRVRAAVTVTGPRGVRLGRRKVALYIGRVAKRRFDRLGTGRLRTSGRGKARGSVRFNAIRGVRKRDFLLFCIRRSSKLGLGRADVVDRRCGARRMPLR